ncbi:MAG: leucyl/phenylalanyl-tRNA--protein transferase [Roseofilum sp. SBFL]|uniref:leucyl/phenylalanyl-tRNA--protein transferase n=1 Tax=unclassified Roseofilum TaxID=2620099 RepID=UPI001B2387AB|nr:MULTISPECIES: leucyl/phenylalanyl-tRNA--protein transferase [unclassified Roseofilum]MBP0012491.1 leucyl/phenylalanyl-tRNA--protein transferase [Roseofilum sp. SID3]MBP0024738.1 leucyl/phenylalanyl-tRNA--protein transferase [Roseofilum sp. SID2]MBP0037600.1 leucyl/phenylalanyl-tRNA--protein transferase [Roseofilum sp. SID1]MBP0041842.1 leucyl/phenylalanyl-tRNA--protein transferase [Roseofilum sp. SBFL]
MDYDIPLIIDGYRQGFFLMSEDEDEKKSSTLSWYSSKARTLIPLDDRFRYPKSLQRVLNQNRFSVAINRDFEAVVEGCADRPSTWISSELKAIYLALYRAGWAYSFETWQNDTLAGGILGIVIGGAFIGESMFFRIPDGSKVAMVKLVEWLRDRHFLLFDAQMMNPHLARFGAYIISNSEYQALLPIAVERPCSFYP